MNKPSWIIIHHSAVSRAKNSEQFDAINNYHKNKGWGEIGYHFLIEPNGELKMGRPPSVVGAHCKESWMNYRSIGICLTGNFDIEEPTPEQKEALLDLIDQLKDKYKIPLSNIVPHRHFAKYKSCWGRRLPDDIIGYLELPDDKPSEWAERAWKLAGNKKGRDGKSIMSGRPKDNITREELAVVLDRLKLI